MSLYKNIQNRAKKGISRPKAKTTINPKTYNAMKNKTGKFKPKGIA